MPAWFEDKKGVVRELPKDAPVRYKVVKPGHNRERATLLGFLGDMPVMEDIEVYDGCSWIPGLRIEDPQEMVFEVRALVSKHCTPAEVTKKVIQEAFRLHDSGLFLQYKVRYLGQPPAEDKSTEPG